MTEPGESKKFCVDFLLSQIRKITGEDVDAIPLGFVRESERAAKVISTEYTFGIYPFTIRKGTGYTFNTHPFTIRKGTGYTFNTPP